MNKLLKNYILFFFIISLIVSCRSSKSMFQFTFKIDNFEQLDKNDLSHLSMQLEQKLAKGGFKRSELKIENNLLIVKTLFNQKFQKKEQDNFLNLFQSHKIEIYDTYRTTDNFLYRIDSALVNIEGFVPYFDKKSLVIPEIYGFCENEMLLDNIASSIDERFDEDKSVSFVWSKEKGEMGFSSNEYYLYVVKKVEKNKIITNVDIKSAESYQSPHNKDDFEIRITLHEQSIPKWTEITTKAANNGNRSLAIIVNNRVVLAPRVNSPITGGRLSISGKYSQKESEKMAQVFNSGPLDYILELIEFHEVESIK